MIKASHPSAGYFTEYIYSISGTEDCNELDIALRPGCNDKSDDGFHCENCYLRKLNDKLYFIRTFIEMKKLLTYQIGLYDDPKKWIKELKQCMKHDLGFKNRFDHIGLVYDALDEIVEVESTQADLSSFISITNIFEGATIEQINMGNGTLIKNYVDVLDQMLIDGVPKEIVDEGAELLKDADKSDSLKKISGNWIKNLPFKVIEKAGEWALKNPDKLAKYQDSLMHWISTQ